MSARTLTAPLTAVEPQTRLPHEPGVAPETSDHLPEDVRIPRPIVLSIVAICVLPYLLMLLGVDFGTPGVRFDPDANNSIDSLFDIFRGSFVHTILEWSAFCAALVMVALAFSHFRISKDPTTPIIGMALFCAGSMDAFHTLAADRLIEAVADNRELIPFTWAICRVFNALIVMIGVGLFLMRGINRQSGGLSFVLLISASFGVVAYAIIHFAATRANLPQTMFPDALITRPWDVGPLLLFLFAGLYLYPRFYRQHPSLFAHALVVSAIPEVVVELHMAFGSTTLFDEHFRVYPGFATKIRQKFISLLLWNRYLMPSSDARRSVGSRWASVCRGWTAVPLPYKGFPARCGCPCSVHTVAACGEVHGLSMRSPALTRHGLDHVDALVQKSPEFSTLTFGRAGTVTTAFRVRKHLVVCCESRI